MITLRESLEEKSSNMNAIVIDSDDTVLFEGSIRDLFTNNNRLLEREVLEKPYISKGNDWYKVKIK
ncbi:hypothetical protein HF295_02625 [Hujiaoplasma nucleasis]|uniref:Uncharacterized protein n=1 Tax=Hujiaoplasma nucleasis TaxID=2725268 RepID=A0A7L6N2X9_9MOLU|nr:hypothetical protein [Hujiaoplasma nucleasis]QLY39812.1 hypothetical protein HF295_02625 [Hujiaoplasma nucleasis]